jgi:hypothetical protein
MRDLRSTAIYLVILICLLLSSCDEVFEQNLNNQSVILDTPTDSLISNNRSVIFSWNQMDASTLYVLQLASPGFDSTSSILLDTTISQNFYLGSLDSGSFQWRVRAYNSSSSTPFSLPRKLILQ